MTYSCVFPKTKQEEKNTKRGWWGGDTSFPLQPESYVISSCFLPPLSSLLTSHFLSQSLVTLLVSFFLSPVISLPPSHHFILLLSVVLFSCQSISNFVVNCLAISSLSLSFFVYLSLFSRHFSFLLSVREKINKKWPPEWEIHWHMHVSSSHLAQNKNYEKNPQYAHWRKDVSLSSNRIANKSGTWSSARRVTLSCRRSSSSSSAQFNSLPQSM